MKSETLTPLTTRVRVSAITCYLLLASMLAQITYWNLARDDGFTIVVWLIQSLPLVAFIPGMIKGVYRAYSWLCFVLLAYFVLAVERVFSTISSIGDFIFLSLIVLLFVSSMLASRWLQRYQKGIAD